MGNILNCNGFAFRYVPLFSCKHRQLAVVFCYQEQGFMTTLLPYHSDAAVVENTFGLTMNQQKSHVVLRKFMGFHKIYNITL